MDDLGTDQELISVDHDGSGLHLLPRKLQVLILGSEWGTSKGGLSTINRELAVNLAKCPEAHVSFFVPQCNDEEKEVARDHKIALIKAKQRRGMAERYWLLCPPSDLHIDVVVGHGVELGPQAQYIRDTRKCKWIQVVHKTPEETGMFRTGLDPVSDSEKEHEDEVALCEEADFVVTVGPKLAEAFRAYLRSCQNQTIFEFTPGILQYVSNVHQVADEGNTFRVLLCGRGDTNDFSLQGFDIAAKAAALSDSHLVFVGAEGNKNEIKTQFRKYGIKSLTVRSTLKDRQRLSKLLCEVDLAVMPARTDGFGVIGLEALSAGLPVLVSRNSGFGEALSKVLFGSSFVIDSEDAFEDVVQEWAKMIKKIRGKDRSQRLEESEALRTFYEKKYSWEKQCKDLIREMVKMWFQDASIGCQSSTQHRTSQQTEGPEGISEHLPGTLQMRFALKSAIFEEGKSGDPERLMHEMTTQFVNTTRTPGNLAKKILKTLYGYLTTVRDLVVILATEGSLRVTVKCKTPEVLEGLWKDYRSGNLNAEAEKRLLTDGIKKRFHVVSVELQTTIRPVDYLACKLFLTSFPQSDEDQTTDETQTQSVEEPEPMTQRVDINYSTGNPGGSNHSQTEEDELETTGKQINEQQGQEEQLTQEQNPATKVQIQLQKQSETMGEQLNERQELGELLRKEQNRVTELQSQLRTMKGELETTREKLREYQVKEELWRQHSYKLQSDLRTRTEELKTTRAEQLRSSKEFHELQSQLPTSEQYLEETRIQLGRFDYQEQLLKQGDELKSQLRTREQVRSLDATKELRLSERTKQPLVLGQQDAHFHRQPQSLWQIRERDLEATTKWLKKQEQEQEQLHQVLEWQSQLRTRAEHELETREQAGKFHGQEELLSQQQEQPSQLQTKDLANWVIHRDEIQFNTNQPLARGAWGLVFRGRFRGSDVAVKQIFSARLSGVTRGSFERQVDIASKCHHPCLLQFIGATADDQPPLFVTEFMDCSLKARLYPRRFLTKEDVTVISLDVARALNYLHQKPLSIIHHNISIGKVLLRLRDGRWRAKVSGYETMNFVRESSGKDVRYHAPEVPHQPVSCKVDVYSFGVLLCEMCIRQEPDPQQRRMQIARIENLHFRELVQRCVEEEPGERPNMEEVIENLETEISFHPKLLL